MRQECQKGYIYQYWQNDMLCHKKKKACEKLSQVKIIWVEQELVPNIQKFVD